MNLPTRLEIQRHKVTWGAAPFLICRTVTPLEFREFRTHCNCFPCRRSRIHLRADLLSHPFGSHLDVPLTRYRYARELRFTYDVKKDIFAKSNALVLLSMMFTDHENRSFDDWPMYIPRKSARRLIQDLLSKHPSDHRSLNGLFFSALMWYSPVRKGPRLFRRALRSHSICPQFPISKIPESVDTWCSDFVPNTDLSDPRTLISRNFRRLSSP